MSDAPNLQTIKDHLKEGANIFIVFGGNVTLDHVAASLALYLSLKKAGFDSLIASPGEMRAEFSYLVGLDKIARTIGNRNLVISFKNYQSGSIEKVSHNDDVNDKFELTIKPKSGHKAPNPKDIDYYYTGAQADLIFIIGTSRLEDLGVIYESETKLFYDVPTVVINRHQNTAYGTVNVIDNGASSLCELTAGLLEGLDYPPEDDIASNLIAGIDFATNRFQNPVISAQAFTMAGKLLSSGGKRPPVRITANQPSTGSLFSSYQGDPSPFARALAANRPPSFNLPPTPTTMPPMPSPVAGTKPPLTPNIPEEPTPSTQPAQGETSAATPESPPEDWSKPKIYQGGTRV